MCVLYFLSLLFTIYAIIGIITGIMFHYEYEWKVDLKIGPEKFGLCWPKYIPKLFAELNVEKKQSNRNMVLDILDNIGYDTTNSSEKFNSNVNNRLIHTFRSNRSIFSFKSRIG